VDTAVIVGIVAAAAVLGATVSQIGTAVNTYLNHKRERERFMTEEGHHHQEEKKLAYRDVLVMAGGVMRFSQLFRNSQVPTGREAQVIEQQETVLNNFLNAAALTELTGSSKVRIAVQEFQEAIGQVWVTGTTSTEEVASAHKKLVDAMREELGTVSS